MELLKLKQQVFEAKHPEQLTRGQEYTIRLGRLAIKADQLGINDPVTHLYRYVEHGTSTMAAIRADIETDIAERLPKTPFVNKVGFEFTGSDFISQKDRVSMRSMTATNLDIFDQESAKNPELAEECERAQAEVAEVEKLTRWFNFAPVGAYQIFESLPIGNQQFAVSRIYRKTDDSHLEASFISLHNPSIDRFNQFRSNINPSIPTADSAIEMLNANYGYFDPNLMTSDQFIDYYVGEYDKVLLSKTGQNHHFGVITGCDNLENGIEKVRKQPKLISVYLDTIRALASSNGVITPELAAINNQLASGHELQPGPFLTIGLVRDILSNVITGIASVIDRADEQLLKDLEHCEEANIAAVSHFGSQAKSEGIKYSNAGCPTVSRNDESPNAFDGESSLLTAAFNLFNTPDSFGRAKIGVCRIANCPSRGTVGWRDERTVVGGCDICVGCHKLFEKGKSPAKIYDEQRKKAAEEERREDEIRRIHKKAA